MDRLKKLAGGLLAYAPSQVQTFVKEEVEIAYWRRVLKESNGRFYNGHFQSRYTDLFSLSTDHFAGKRILDIGCGPLGSLAWADNAAERVGVDPLADRYRKLNQQLKGMQLVKAGSEALPFEDAHFDVVSCFNALDHVEDVERSVAEITRVLASGGDLLIIVEIDHPATLTEPHRLTEEILDSFKSCRVLTREVYAIRDDHDVYKSLRDAVPRRQIGDPAILCARLVRA
jgi:ubiquinone/menaquinone biosynthesis C-methylase UbiE